MDWAMASRMRTAVAAESLAGGRLGVFAEPEFDIFDDLVGCVDDGACRGRDCGVAYRIWSAELGEQRMILTIFARLDVSSPAFICIGTHSRNGFPRPFCATTLTQPLLYRTASVRSSESFLFG